MGIIAIRGFALGLLLASAVLSGCGDGGGSSLADCGNGVLDSGEDCDDGNLADDDACLSTCRAARCGDGFLDPSAEECDIGIVTKTCRDLGFASGSVDCTASCAFDTSSCRGNGGPTPIATATPAVTGSGPIPTGSGATPSPATPTPQATPVGTICSGSESIVVTLTLDAAITSARLDLGYPASANLPGSGTDKSVKDRVDFAGSGLTVVNDADDSGDLVDDTLTMSLVSTDVTPAGSFATVTFDCVAGQPVPSAGDFPCTVVSASNAGTTTSPACTVALQ